MTFSIHPVDVSDVDALIRQVEYPAHQNNPLHLLMFPGSDKQDEQREEEIQWMIDGLRQTILEANTTLRKACKEEGLPIGLIGWITEQKIVRIVEKNEDGTIIPPAELRPKNVRMKKQPDTRCPTTMDVESWLRVSKQLREERQRALRQCRGITFMAVNPDHQRQGVGSMLMQSVCDKADENNLDAFVMSSPAGIRLYSKFGFKATGIVQTSQGVFTSMIRIARSYLIKPSGK